MCGMSCFAVISEPAVLEYLKLLIWIILEIWFVDACYVYTGNPARGVGWRDPGFFHTSFLKELWPNREYEIFSLLLYRLIQEH